MTTPNFEQEAENLYGQLFIAYEADVNDANKDKAVIVEALRAAYEKGIAEIEIVREVSGNRLKLWMDATKERDALKARVGKYREVLEEVALPPYHDSDLASLLETLRVRAKAALDEDGGNK